MKKILIPTDFSQNSNDAFSYSMNLIGNSKAEIHLIHVVEPIVQPSDVPIIAPNLIKMAQDDAEKALKEMEVLGNSFFEKNGNVTLFTKVENGNISERIKREAKHIEADMIIMGSKGSQHHLIEKLLGTVSTAVIDEAPCPVILVPVNYTFKPIDNLIFATNLSHSDPFDLWKAAEILLPKVNTVRCIHVVKDLKEKDNVLIEEFAKYMISHSPSVNTIFHIEESANIEEVISNYSLEYGAEMIVMHKTKQTIFHQMFHHSHTKKMVYLIQVPLLVMNEV